MQRRLILFVLDFSVSAVIETFELKQKKNLMTESISFFCFVEELKESVKEEQAWARARGSRLDEPYF